PCGNRSRLREDRSRRTKSPGVEWRAKPHGNLLRDGGLLYNGSDNASGAQTGRRGGAGPVGGLLGGKDLTGRFFAAQKPGCQSSPQPLAVRHLSLVWARRARTPPTGSPSEITGRDDFAAGARDEPGQDAEVHAGLEKADRAVREHGVGAAGVKAVH